jgi:hypothetical protein
MKSIMKVSVMMLVALSIGSAAYAEPEMNGYEKASQYLASSNMHGKTKKHRDVASTKHKKKKKKKKHRKY